MRATPGFFEDLDRQLRAERGPNGEPSTNDFQVFELIPSSIVSPSISTTCLD